MASMVRPSRNLDKVLLKTGIQMMRRGGASSISIRRLCEKAKVSLGMFNYLFKSRDVFLLKVHQELYRDFCSHLAQAAEQHGSPMQQLRAALLTLSELVFQQRKLFMILMRDAMNGETVTKKLQKDFVPEDLLMILNLIRKCRADGSISMCA